MDIAIDFDGTCTTHEFPQIGRDIGAQPVLRRLVRRGHKLILFTMRSDRPSNGATGDDSIKDVVGNFLTDAVDWFIKNEIPLYAVQQNPTQHKWTTSPKCYAQLYIDDAALGCPTKLDLNISLRPFVDWSKVEDLLTDLGLFELQETEKTSTK
jgi:hypothetical protein